MDVKPLFVRWIKLTIKGKDGIVHEFQCSVTQAGLTSAGGDVVALSTLCPTGSYSENAERTWNLTVTGVQDVESAESFQMFLLEHDGEEAEFTYYPKVDRDENPVGRGFKGTVTIGPPDTVGNVASGAWATFTANLPLKGKYTMIDEDGNEIVPSVTPTGVTPGTPGTFQPANATPPANLAALQALGPLGQATAWTTGQYVVLGDSSQAHWDASAWVAGAAP